jgi:hypothetical protein
MKSPIRIFLSFDDKDTSLAAALAPHLLQAFPGEKVIFWENGKPAPEDYRKEAGAFLEKTQLFLAIVSVNYLDDPNIRWELDQAVALSRKNRLKVLTVMGRSAFVPEALIGFPVSPGPSDPLVHDHLNPDRQLQRVALAVRQLLGDGKPLSAGKSVVTLDLTLADLQERLLNMLDRVDLTPLFSLLKRMLFDAAMLKDIFESEDSFSNLYQQTRGMKTNLDDYLARKLAFREQLRKIIERMRDEDLNANWRDVFIPDYFSFLPSDHPALDPYFFFPTEEVAIPDTMNLPVSIGEQASAENIGLLSYQQKQDFRRSLLLAQDAIAVENYARAHAHCEHVRSHLDPQSAQLYEYLLITYIHKEKSDKIIEEALTGEGRGMNHVTLYSGRLRLYQEGGKCPSLTGIYNRRVSAEILSDGMRQVYDTWPDDYVLDTGRHTRPSDTNRQAARRFIEAAQLVYRAIHPMRGAFRLLVNELCGGGKFHWVSRVVFADEEIRFLSNESFDLESQIDELLGLIGAVDEGRPDQQYQQQSILRENLYFSLLAKRQLLFQRLTEETKANRQFTDVHESAIRFIHAALLGHRVFGDASQDGKDQSFLRLSLEYLLPTLVVSPDPDALLPGLRWFDLDSKGQLCAHTDSVRYQFDARAILEKIVRDHAGKAAWMQVAPNIKQEVYQQYIADTEKTYEIVKTGLSWTDFRRMDELEARKLMIGCLRRWVVCYRAFPETGAGFIERAIQEICGDGLLVWLYHDPAQLVSHPDALALGYDARQELRMILGVQSSVQTISELEEPLRVKIAENLFKKRILPAWGAIPRGDERHRSQAIRLLLEATAGYRLWPNPAYLDFVYQELTEELKFRWIDVHIGGDAMSWSFVNDWNFDPVDALEKMYQTAPSRYNLFAARERIADRRFRDIQDRYFREISEIKSENRRPERESAIQVISKLKGLYRYMPREKYLELPLKELKGQGRVRWNARLLGLIPTRENYYENQYFQFDYKYELFDIKRLLENQFNEMERVLKDTGEVA